jgi:BASS family bile acid:Na+ symporter
MDLMIRFLAASAARGSLLLAIGIFGGLLVPPLAHAMRGILAPTVVGLMTLVLLRVDVAATLAHLRRPGRLAVIVAFHLLVCPVIAWAAVSPGYLDDGIAAGTVIFATGCAAVSGAAFARLVGLDPDLSLIATLATTFLVPLTAAPLAYALTGVDLAITMSGFMQRLALVVGLPLCASMAIRWWVGEERLRPLGPAVDGALVWLVVFYGFAVMDGLLPRLRADPGWVAQAAIVAFATDFGLNAITTLALWPLGGRVAAAAGMLSGNRNMALYLAVLPAAADPRIGLFFSICQFPLFLSPFILRGFYRRLLGRLSAAIPDRTLAG